MEKLNLVGCDKLYKGKCNWRKEGHSRGCFLKVLGKIMEFLNLIFTLDFWYDTLS